MLDLIFSEPRVVGTNVFVCYFCFDFLALSKTAITHTIGVAARRRFVYASIFIEMPNNSQMSTNDIRPLKTHPILTILSQWGSVGTDQTSTFVYVVEVYKCVYNCVLHFNQFVEVYTHVYTIIYMSS